MAIKKAKQPLERSPAVSRTEQKRAASFISHYPEIEEYLDIFSKDNCLLPTIKDSSYVHKELFRIFNKHLKKTLNKDVKLCPIT